MNEYCAIKCKLHSLQYFFIQRTPCYAKAMLLEVLIDAAVVTDVCTIFVGWLSSVGNGECWNEHYASPVQFKIFSWFVSLHRITYHLQKRKSFIEHKLHLDIFVLR